jgi:transposase-like protein
VAEKPTNIVSIYKRFPSEASCLAHIEQVRWKGRPTCPYCTSTQVTKAKDDWRHHCNACNTSFSVTVNTIFHHTHLDLQKWFLAISLMLNAKKGISARQLARDIEVNKNTAWYLNMRIRRAMLDSAERELLTGICEMDETYIGGKPRPGGPPLRRGRGTKKQPVVGIIERGGRVRAQVVKKNEGLTAKRLSTLVRQNVDIAKATIYTDEFNGYLRLSGFVKHGVVNHKVWYVDGDKHTNSMESFWALLKRGIVGQYHKVSLRHLPQYINEFCYRFNHRKSVDVFDVTICRALGV